MIIALCGCLIQQEETVERVKRSFPFIDICFGTHALYKFPEILHNYLEKKERTFDVPESDGVIAENLPIKRDGVFKAWLPVSYGCDNFCSYCVVPFVRGRERSRKSEDIIKEFGELVDSGYKEITLLGQNVNSYGKGLDEDINFPKLLKKLCEKKGDYLIKFMTSHPKDMTKELVDVMAFEPNIAKYIHLPVQSGNDEILKAMNRGYTVAQYLEKIKYIKEKIPDITLSSDIIVGFPGETYGQFLDTLELLKTVEFDFLFTFIFSKRPKTAAFSLEDPDSHEEKSKRLNYLLKVQQEIGCKRNGRFEGKTVRVFCENKMENGWFFGRTDGNIGVEFEAEDKDIGSFKEIKITEALNYALRGGIVK